MVDYLLEDVERIEVIRGPGATLWGGNAVNGIVNIITRSSRDTQGAFASIAAGTEDRAIVQARYGAMAGTTGWRVYGKFADRDGQRLTSGAPSGDARRGGQAGFRVDGGIAAGTNWRVSGDVFHSRDSLPDRPDGEFADVNLTGRWSGQATAESRITVQSYYRREYRRVPRQLTHHIDVFDVDAQHNVRARGRHDIVWGGGARVNWDETHGSAVLQFEPPSRRYALYNAFVQDEIALIPDRLFTTVGAKWEHNAFSGGELQPSIRARLLVSPTQMAWGAVSRAVRRPTRFEDDVVALSPVTGLPLIVGSDAFVPESLVASEAGYRLQPSTLVSIEVSVFHHSLDNVRSQDLPPAGPPLVVGNSLDARSRGIELAVNVQPARAWRTHAGYTWLDADVRREPGSRDVSGGVSEANDPHHLFTLRSSLDLPRGLQVDGVLRSVGALPNPRVPAFTELNLRVAWRATPAVELWAAGQDLLHDRHREFGPAVEFERALRAGLTFRY
jgi:iron complex outermembrane receptor protein